MALFSEVLNTNPKLRNHMSRKIIHRIWVVAGTNKKWT